MSLELQKHQTNGKKNQQQCMIEKPVSHIITAPSPSKGESSTILTLLWVIRNLSASETMTSSCIYMTMSEKMYSQG